MNLRAVDVAVGFWLIRDGFRQSPGHLMPPQEDRWRFIVDLAHRGLEYVHALVVIEGLPLLDQQLVELGIGKTYSRRAAGAEVLLHHHARVDDRAPAHVVERHATLLHVGPQRRPLRRLQIYLEAA